ncbi:MAG: peroxide stress protein YaaA [Saprospiraceae bacterium]|nr:peroxide stress protein YaaA [Saprospiraceae bacterium]
MIILLSPAKSLNFEPDGKAIRSQPRFKNDTWDLANQMRTKKPKDLQALMSISQKLADLNVARYQAFSKSHTLDNSKQAVFAFTGDVYQGLQASSFSEKELAYAQDHVRILSGLYGVLRPLDVIQPYRLEMGTKLKTERGKDLYDFWGNSITSTLNKDLKNSRYKAIINLASQEYFKAVRLNELKADLYDIQFKEWRNNAYKFVSFNAKKARGFMTQFIVKKKILNPEKIKGFNLEGYAFNEELSSDREWTFTR